MSFEVDENSLWREAERRWSAHLSAQQWVVMNLAGVGSGSEAPLIAVNGGMVRAPDLMATKAGVTVYWEVKFRTTSHSNPITGEREHWMERAKVNDYLRVHHGTQCEVNVVLFDSSSRGGLGQWFVGSIDELIEAGRRDIRWASDLSEIDAWVWPKSAMRPISGPEFDMSGNRVSALPDEGEGKPVPLGVMAPIERNLRRKSVKSVVQNENGSTADEVAKIENVISNNFELGLQVLALETLKLRTVPKYSVLQIGDQNIDVDELLGLLHYGIRVFLITPTKKHQMDAIELEAFEDSRLLEWAIVPEAFEMSHTIVDGIDFSQLTPKSKKILELAANSGAINQKQYEIVHASPDEDIVVRAGAGTGKTETMSERIVFLLANAETIDSETGLASSSELRLDEIVLVTFTREAARQMRERLTKTLVLRKRLSRNCVLPVVAWMMQLSSSEISTIQSYAKSIAQQGAATLGLSPGFRVSKLTMQFREVLYRSLSPHLEVILDSWGPSEVPAAHEWRELIESIWNKLDNNGIEIMPLSGGNKSSLSWPLPSRNISTIDLDASKIVKTVIDQIGIEFAEICEDNQAIPTSKLVTTALAVLRQPGPISVRVPKYVFVDEFQDTDDEQMSMFVEIRKRLDARLFVVGDVKQAIYRFRGAEGNAFKSLNAKYVEFGTLEPYPLSRNFRSGKFLLDSLHPYFEAWGKDGLLEYVSNEDRLEANPKRKGQSKAVDLTVTNEKKYLGDAVDQVRAWIEDSKKHDRKPDVAVLCRQNWTAIEIKQKLVEVGIPCELVVGGDFFRVPAVREMRALLEAVVNPFDSGALLELLETRWAARIMSTGAPEGIDPADRSVWEDAIDAPISWIDRLSSLSTGSFETSDLDGLRLRMISLKKLVGKMPALSWLVLCWQHFSPDSCEMPGNNESVERPRYVRCLEHLLMLMDAEFSDTPISLPRILQWLQLQIATNSNEDEPFNQESLVGKVTALTVHKSKGLEFDNVLIPRTWDQFSKKRRKFNSVITIDAKNNPRVVWEWHLKRDNRQVRISNVSESDASWDEEINEVRSEEARLLYVATTRAREELVVFIKTDSPKTARSLSDSKTWSDLIRKVKGL